VLDGPDPFPPAAARAAGAGADAGDDPFAAEPHNPGGKVTPQDRLADPELRLEHAREIAWRALNRREHTVGELAAVLERKRVEPEFAAAILAELQEGGWVDDAGYAQRFAEDRRNLDGWGSERIARRLRSLGIAPEHVEAAVGARAGDDEMEAALDLLRRRFPQPPETPRDVQRALGVLVRKGYESDLAYDALRRHAKADEDF
jgi:regulatory protein